MSLNSLLDKAISVANVAGKKTEEMVEASKLKLQEVSVNADLQDCYEKIGSLVYRSKKSGEDNEQAIEQLVEQADVLLEQLAQLQSKREEIKKDEEVPELRRCVQCGLPFLLQMRHGAARAERPGSDPATGGAATAGGTGRAAGQSGGKASD